MKKHVIICLDLISNKRHPLRNSWNNYIKILFVRTQDPSKYSSSNIFVSKRPCGRERLDAWDKVLREPTKRKRRGKSDCLYPWQAAWVRLWGLQLRVVLIISSSNILCSWRKVSIIKSKGTVPQNQRLYRADSQVFHHLSIQNMSSSFWRNFSF